MRGNKEMQNIKRIGMVLLAFMTLNTAGCAIFQAPPVKYLPNDNSMMALNHIAEKAQQSTAVIAEIQAKNAVRRHVVSSHRGYKQFYKTKSNQSSNPRSQEKLSFSFEGPVNLAVQKLSEKSGYQFMMGANQLKSFPTVSIIESSTPLSNIVLKINQQLPANIRVICYPKTKSLLLVVQSTGA